MKIVEYITSLRSQDIIVSVRDASVKVNAPDGAITPEILQELKHRKHEILDFFKTTKKVKEFESIPKASEALHYPLSAAQRRMYFLYEFDKDSTTYNMPSFYRVSRDLDVSQLEKTFKDLSDRHHSLRSVFELVDGHPVQRVLKDNSFKLSYQQGATSDIEDYIADFVRPFDLSKDLPLRVSLIDVLDEDYLLMIDIHHIINDGVSNEVLMHDFWLLYHGQMLPNLRIQYTDYAVWQQSSIYQELVSKHKEYWLELYNDDLTALALPTDYTRPLQSSDRGGVHTVTMSKIQSDKLRSIASSEGVTVYMLFLTIYNVLLSKLSNQSDIVVGTPTAGRHHADLNDLVGMFVNTLALRNQIAADLSFKNLLANVKQNTLMAFDHQLYPYEELVDALGVSGDTDRNPLFDVFFSYGQHDENQNVRNDSELNIVTHEVPYTVAKFNLELDVEDQGNNFVLRFNYNLSLFKDKTIQRFSRYLQQIIDEVLQDENIEIAEIDILTTREKDQILYEFNAPEVEYNSKGTIIDLIEEQVSCSPQAKAIYFREHELAYGELNKKVNQLTHYLLDVMRVQKGDRVGLYLGRSPEMFIGFLAILKSGATYVPLDPENPSDRINMLIEDSGMNFILTNSIADTLKIKSTVKVVDLIQETAHIEQMSKSNPSAAIKGSDAAYVIFTSGSTGRPKGVVITHDALLDYSITFKEYFSLTFADKVIQQASPAFDTVVEEVFPALLSGAAIVIVPEGGRNIEALITIIKQTKATVLSTVPVVIEALNNYTDDLKSLRFLISGGDLLLPRHIDKLIENHEIFNTYGPSESTVCISYHKISSLDNTSCIGKPIANRQVYILDNNRQLCPVGVAGELCVSGKGLAKEYLNDTKLTNEKFIENPIIPSTRIYCTGDAARWNPDGTIEFLGRIDDQVKIRGVRIELGEIASQLENIDAVDQALVVAHGTDANKQLIAYLCGGEGLENNEIRSLLLSKLPDYMVPTGYVWLDSFPLTTNGKIAKRLLPVPDLAIGIEYIAPENEDQEKLVTIWSEILGVEKEKIGIHSDFFVLGGHSLTAISLVNKINKELSVELPLRDLFVYRTISDLSGYIASLERSNFVAIPKAKETDYYPLSSAQRRMYFLYEFDKNAITYNMPSFLRLSRTLDVFRLDAVFNELIDRHQSLRTVYELVDNVPVQRILDSSAFEIIYQQGDSSEMERYISDFVRPFDIGKELPIRITLMDVLNEDYLLLIDMHHISNDGVSSDILMRDFWALYHDEMLPDLPVQYIDYAVWQGSEAHQELVLKHKSYWLDVFEKEPSSLNIPTDFPRTSRTNNEGEFYSMCLDKSQSQALRDFVNLEGVTMYTLFLTIYNVLLSKLSGQEDIVIGTPTSGRHHVDIEGVVGMFVNTLALRNRPKSDLRFVDFLSKVQEDTAMAFDHQFYQYEELVDTLNISRNVGRNPMFDVFFSYAKGMDETNFSDSDLIIKGHDVAHIVAKFDLSLAVVDTEEIELSFSYRKDLFTKSSITRFADYLGVIIENVTRDGTQLLEEINVLSEEEHKLLTAFNDTKTNYESDKTVLDLFREQVQLRPNAKAVIFEEEQLTYNELNIRSDHWATKLVQLGVEKGTIVGLMTTRSMEMITGILGIMKAGAAYVPINPDQPVARTEHMLEECCSQFLISNIETLPGEINEVYTCLKPKLLDSGIDIEKEAGLPEVLSGDLAYVIYTSGSTGRPKGVLIEHNGLTNLNCFQRTFFEINETDRILQFSPYYFDASVEQIWLALAGGGALVLIQKDCILDSRLFRDYLSKNKVSYVHATPSFLENLPIDELPSIDIVISGGEKCKSSLVNQFIGKCRFINEYGPTEGTVVSMAYEVEEKMDLNKSIPIGKPIANTQAYILSPNKKIVPLGVIGELYIGGVHLAKGYVNKPSLTAERFIENPFGEGRLYRTGDLAKWLPDGNIEFVGRNDDQVKIRGFRIELGEIEAQLENLEEIKEALVIDYGPENNKQLVAYLCGEEELEVSEVSALLSNKLPDYMIPTNYVWLSQFPLTPNGKIDRKALPAPDFTDNEVYIAPENDEQKLLTVIWSEVLEIEAERIGINADFFNLGGHSLTAITVANKINKAFSVELPLRDLFVYRTIAALSTHVLSLDRSDFISIPKAEDAAYYPLSSAQRRMYFLYEFDKEGTTYNMPSFFRINRALNVSHFEGVFKKLVQRHHSLRTIFEIVDDIPVQRITDTEQFKINYHKGNATEVNSYVEGFVRAFDLSSEVPLRVSLVAIENEDYLVMMDMHHIINDGVSYEILLQDFWSLYNGENLGEPSLQYKDYAVWQQGDSQQTLVSKDRSYWLDRFSEEVTKLELPSDYSRPRNKNHQGGLLSIHLDQLQSDALRSIAKREGVTIYTLFLSIYTVLLNKLSNQKDIVVGTPTAGRHHVDLEGMVGMFVNTLALRNYLDADVGFVDFLRSVQESTLLAFDHQSYQYEELVDALNLSRDASRNPLFDVFYSYRKEQKTIDFSNSDITIKNHEVDYNITKFDLQLDVVDMQKGFEVTFNYSLSLFEEQTIERFSKYFGNIVSEVLSDNKVKLSEISILSEEERSELLYEFSATEASYNLDHTFLDLFKTQVSSSPNDKAVILGETRMTYGELDSLSDLWATHLVTLGVISGDIVGLMTTRSVDMITGILGIMKAGAAYLPINSNQPVSRTLHMLEDCDTQYLITNVDVLPDSIENNYVCLRPLILGSDNADEKECMLPSVTGKDLAYIIYTSGSTGKPKGVMIDHDSVSNLINSQAELFGMGKGERILQFSPYYFDASVEQIGLSLITGSCLVLLKESLLMDLNGFTAYLQETKVTHLHATPSFLEKVDIRNLPNLHRVIAGGEICKPSLAKKISDKCAFYNEYGPTETTVTSTIYKVEDTVAHGNSISIGRPIGNTQAYVLDGEMNLVPKGVIGELYIGGKGLSKGYLKRPDLTVERFVENPFGQGRLYRTGDMVRWQSDGTLEYFGRNDHQVKIRGYRIELGEITAQLEHLDQVDQALVVAHGPETNKQLAAYLCGERTLDSTKIKALLSEELPDYMIPTAYVWLDRFPQTSNGKVDMKALPTPDLTIGEVYVAPENDEQELLTIIWSEVLGIEAKSIGINSDFFSLGGHSLTAITLINKVNKAFSVDVPLRDFFVSRTISELDIYIKTSERIDFVSISKAPPSAYYPLSSAQRRMYFLYEFDKEGTTYNMPSFYRIEGALDVSNLESTFKELVARHQSLRTIFELVDDVPVQKIIGLERFEISYHKGTTTLIDSYITDFVRPFDLSSELPIRVALIEVAYDVYLLMLDTHHIVNDGVSQEILLRDFWSLYNGDNLEMPALEYTDYAVWQQSESHKKMASGHKEYWLDLFSERITTLELPTDRPRPAQRDHRGGIYSMSLDHAQGKRLKEIAKQKGVTLYTLFLTIYNILLSKLSNQEDIVVGTPIAGRYHADLEHMVGMFVNTLALRNQLGSEMNFMDFLASVHRSTLMALDHQSYQYEELVDALDVTRNLGRNPLFDVFFSYGQKREEVDFGESQIKITGHDAGHVISKFDLKLDVTGQEESFDLTFTYRTSLFNAESIERFSAYFNRIIEAVLDNTEIGLSEIEILSDAERTKLVMEFNAAQEDYDCGLTMLDSFRARAKQFPENSAIIHGGNTFSYETLDDRSDLWAKNLIRLGVGPGTIVGLVTARSLDMVTGILGIMKAGAAYLPINPDQPMARTNYMLEESDAKFLVTNVKGVSADLEENYICVQAEELDLNTVGHGDIELPKVSSDDLAYVIYTSGSTGKPKGVMVQHESLSNLIQYETGFLGIDNTEKILQFSPYYFDASVEQIWLPLTSGSSLVLLEESKLLETADFKKYLKEKGVTHLHATPSFLEKMDIANLPGLRRVISGGEVCKPSLANKISKHYVFYNKYGPTEATVTSTVHRVEHTEDMENSISIGKPVGNAQAYVLDPDLRLLPEGVMGELYIGGKGLSKGYLKRPDLTAERFVENPYGEGRLYRTGDMVRWLPDGNLSYLGRNDDQVKIRGYRIELGEITAQLEQLSQIDQALVVAHGPETNKQLVGYLCGENALDDSKIKSQLSKELPDYMIPTAYVWLDRFPQTSNGKVDMKALPAPDLTAREVYIAPENAEQELLVAIWADVLDIEKEKIGISSDFFVLGGHSLTAISLANKINRSFSVELPLRDLFVHRTIAALSIHLASMDRSDFVSIPKAEVEEYYPMSSAQRRMYFLYELDSNGTTYNMPGFFRIGGDLDIARLENAFKGLVSRHESLRTIFEVVDGVPMQRPIGADNFEMRYEIGVSADIDVHTTAFIRPFDLGAEIPIRVSLMEVENEEHLLMIDMHHIISDGVSYGILMRDFWSLYNGDNLEMLTLEYTDYAVWQQSESHKKMASGHKEYWLDLFSERVTTLELPTDRPRPARQDHRGGIYSMSLDHAQGKRLKEIAEQKGVTLYTLFLTVYNILLSKLSNQEDIVVGTPIAGRYHADLEHMVGMLVNTLALRNQLGSEMNFMDFLASVHRSTLMALDHQSYQYEELVDALDVTRNLGRNPLFDVFFSYGQKREEVDFGESQIKITGHDAGHVISKFDLKLDVTGQEESFDLTFTYRTSLFNAESIERFSAYFNRIIEAVLDNTEIGLSEIEILSDAERTKLVVEFNASQEDYDCGLTMLDSFRARAKQFPENSAIIHGSNTLSYETLDDRSDLWAKNLIRLGVAPGTIVGLVTARSLDMVTGILGIMKAGAAYLPINPDQPMARTNYMLEESDAKFLVTNVKGVSADLEENYICVQAEELDLNTVGHGDIELPKVSSDDLAYVIYTSGSTGKPKGVMVQHESLSNLIQYETGFLGIDNTEKILQFSPYYFDASVEQIWLPLTSGSSLVLLEESKLLETADFKKYLKEKGVTHLHATPSFLEKMDIANLPGLRRVISGGEVCKPSLANKISKHYVFYNKYGPTEATVTSTVHRVEHTEDMENSISIGKPVGNAQAYVLDPDLRLLPEGVMGELYIGGKGLSKGYLKRPDLTAERFVENPYGEGRLYRTGDMVRWLPDGNLSYLGRNDDQVKIRGYRIELGEITAQLEQLSQIDQALVIAHGTDENKQLFAYVCGTETIDNNVIRVLLSEILPEYMIPMGYVWMDTFPITSNGKIDKRALPSPDFTLGEVYMAPETENQDHMVILWSDILDIDAGKIGVNSDFFSLGGHSLSAMKLKYQIKNTFKVELSLAEIFKTPTIMALTQKVEEGKTKEREMETLIMLNQENTKNQNLFMIHDGSGEIDGYLELTRRMGEYNCYGLKFNQFDAMTAIPKIEEIASKYVQEIQAIQEVGPYYLLGWSLGGKIAVEMTAQLERIGEKVENLVLIDTSLTFDEPMKQTSFDLESEMQLMKSKFDFSTENMETPNSINELWTLFSNSERFKKSSMDDVRSAVPKEMLRLIPDFFNRTNQELFEATNKIRVLVAASENYGIDKRIQANTMYFRPIESGSIAKEEMQINAFDNVTLQYTEGDHFSVMTDPIVEELAILIKNYLTSFNINELAYVEEYKAQ